MKTIRNFSYLLSVTVFFLLFCSLVNQKTYAIFTYDSTIGNQNGISKPEDIAIDSSDNKFITDVTFDLVTKLDSNDAFVLQWGQYGSGNGQFNNPRGIDVDSVGNVYVEDAGNKRIQKFDNNGNYISQWPVLNLVDIHAGSPSIRPFIFIGASDHVYVFVTNSYFTEMGLSEYDSNGTFIRQFSVPYDVVDAEYNSTTDSIYLLRQGRSTVNDWDKIEIYSNSGVLQSTWGTYGSADGQFDSPLTLTVESDGTVLVMDYANMVQKFSPTGTFIEKYGVKGTNLGQINSARSAFVDSTNRLYYVESGVTVQVFSNAGVFVKNVGLMGSGNGQFSSPSQSVLDSGGNLYVIDYGNIRIQKFNSNGEFLNSFVPASSTVLNRPTDIAVDSHDNVFVVTGGFIDKYNSAGSFISTTTLPFGSFANKLYVDEFDDWILIREEVGRSFPPASIIKFVDGDIENYSYLLSAANLNILRGTLITYDAVNSHYIVSDSTTNIVTIFDTSFTQLGEFGTLGSGDGQFSGISGLTVDSLGYIYVTDRGNNRVQKFTSAGVFVTKYGTLGSDEYGLNAPSGISVYSNGDMAIVDTNNHRVLKYTDGFQIILYSPTSSIVDSTLGFSISSESQYGITRRMDGNRNLLGKNNGIPVFGVSATLDSTKDWSLVTFDSSIVSGKAVVANLNPTDAPGVSSTHSLYVPKLAGQTSVYVCPSATQLSEVTLGCVGGYNLTEGSPSLTTVNIDGQAYWVITGLTGTGALGLSQIGTAFTLTPNNSAVSTTQEVVMSYGTTSSFAALDKVQFHFEPTAGFVLANTCATPTTDANNDLTVDGAGAIVGSDVYEYTFSDTVTGPSTVSFCVSVTSPATAGSYSVRLTDDNGSFGATMYYVGGDNEVFVIANVAPSLSFNIRTLADDADTNVCSFGTVSPSDTLPNYDNVDDGASECGYSLAVGTNAANGFQVQITADDQLNGTSGNIADISNGVGFVAGVEAYGLANVTSSTSGRNVTTGGYTESILRNGNFNLAANTGTNIPLSATNFISYTNGIQYVAGVDSLDTTSVMHGLVIGSGTPAGYYDQVVTYTTTANF